LDADAARGDLEADRVGLLSLAPARVVGGAVGADGEARRGGADRAALGRRDADEIAAARAGDAGGADVAQLAAGARGPLRIVEAGRGRLAGAFDAPLGDA